MRSSKFTTLQRRFTVIVLYILVAGTPLTAQRRYDRHPVPRHPLSLGGYVGLGANTAQLPLARQTGIQGQVGLFGEWASHALRPGLDMRFTGHTDALPSIWGLGNSTSGSAKLIGPRLSYSRGSVHPYAEGLFGSAHEGRIPQPGIGPAADLDGVMKQGVIGVDFDADTHAQIRVEYTAGRIGAPQSYLQQTVTAALVFRFP